MKRLFGLKKKKIKIGGDEDDDQNNDTTYNQVTQSYSPPSVGKNNVAYDFQQVSSFPSVILPSTNDSSSSAATPPIIISAALSPPSSVGLAHQINNPNDDDTTIGAGYRYALTAYNDTISPALSNEDGMGGGGGTLRSRIRGSGGKHKRSLIPSFQPLDDDGSTTSTHNNNYYYGTPLQNDLHNSSRNNNRRAVEGEGWSPIPEEPRSNTSSDGRTEQHQEEGGGSGDDKKSSDRVVTFDSSIEECGIGPKQTIPPSSTRSTYTSQQSFPTKRTQQQQQSPMMILLQPDAIYEENYGDAYIDKWPKYLYPSGYQSMRPRSGPWKLSIFIFCLFLWLSVFIVGHCYDRGKQYGMIDDDAAVANNDNDDDGNGNNDAAVDDAYLAEVDDDAVLMETRWCGSKMLHFMWMISVAITVLAMSYCSIIGYVKVRDIAVAAGRSQPAGTFNGGNEDGKSDYYSKVDNVSGGTGAGEKDEESGSNPNNNNINYGNDQYPSYQAGQDGNRRYEPSIYQSNGMPQFLGGHIYRPTQAAITMTNRP